MEKTYSGYLSTDDETPFIQLMENGDHAAPLSYYLMQDVYQYGRHVTFRCVLPTDTIEAQGIASGKTDWVGEDLDSPPRTEEFSLDGIDILSQIRAYVEESELDDDIKKPVRATITVTYSMPAMQEPTCRIDTYGTAWFTDAHILQTRYDFSVLGEISLYRGDVPKQENLVFRYQGIGKPDLFSKGSWSVTFCAPGYSLAKIAFYLRQADTFCRHTDQVYLDRRILWIVEAFERGVEPVTFHLN